MWLNDVGIRVADVDRSVKFYTEVLGLTVVKTGGSVEHDQKWVLLRDPRSGQKLELNWHAPGSRFGTPYVLGEALDHMEVRVKSVPDALKRLESQGIRAIDMRPYFDRHEYPYGTMANGHRQAFIADPDGIQFCIYDHPEEPVDAPPGETY